MIFVIFMQFEFKLKSKFGVKTTVSIVLNIRTVIHEKCLEINNKNAIYVRDLGF